MHLTVFWPGANGKRRSDRKAYGDLNDFNQFFGNGAVAVIQPDERGRLPFDAPNRVLAWGQWEAPFRSEGIRRPKRFQSVLRQRRRGSDTTGRAWTASLRCT